MEGQQKKERSRSALWHKAECCLYERWLKRTLRRESRNHSNFPGALWRTDNRVREEFLFLLLHPSLPSSLPLTCSHFHSSLGQFVGFSHPILFSFMQPAFWMFLFFLHVCFLKCKHLPCEIAIAVTTWCYLFSVTFMDPRNYLGTLFPSNQKPVLHWGNVLQKHSVSSWFLCLRFRGCAVKPWCCPRDQSPWDNAMPNSKYNPNFVSLSLRSLLLCISIYCISVCTVCG